jgi:hypothetical protein
MDNATLRNESKAKLNEINNDEDKLDDLEDERVGVEHELYYNKRPLTPEQKEQHTNRLGAINKEINRINKNSNLKPGLTSTMSTARVASLPSFQSRNSANVDKVLSDPNLLKHITNFNTNLGGKKRRKHSKKHIRKNKNRKNKSTKRRRYKK